MFKNKEIKDTFQAFLVDGADFTDIEQYPILEKDMISNDIPNKIISFDKYREEKDLSNCFICFYAPDESFEKVRRNPKRYLDLFKRCKGIIGFDFSVHTDMPLIKQKSQMNDNLSLTFYYAKQGIKVIPNIRYGIEDTADEYLKSFPKNTLIAVGTHGFIKTKLHKFYWLRFLDKIIDELNPTGIIVYGTLNGLIFDSIKKKVPIYCYDSWIDKRVKEVNKNVNKRS